MWRDAGGDDVIFGLTTDEHHWVRVTGAGSYRFPLTNPDLVITAEGAAAPGATEETLVDSYYRTIVPMALHAYGFETLHGSGVAIRGGVVALCAPPRNGKSTIAFALGQRGHAVVADDSVVLDLEPARPEVVPLPFEVRLRGRSAAHFSQPSKREVKVGETSVNGVGRSRLAAVVLLSQGGVEVAAERLSPEAAFKALLAQSQIFSVSAQTRKGAMMRNYLRLAGAVPVYRLAYPTGLEHLDAICERIERLADGSDDPVHGAVTDALFTEGP